jgi:hypothetical protein
VESEIIYLKILYLIHLRPLGGGTAAGGRQGEGAAYPTTSHPEMKWDLSDYASEFVPTSKERNSRDARFYRGNTAGGEQGTG